VSTLKLIVFADKGDAKWKSVLRDPYGKVSYMLVARNSAGSRET